ncbi:hypothetical protein L0Y65_00775 [Candidatus Micrarchaeota archaeon]|nr:hypothetical protein [Candidatus Micrarchaeota archaeon]
MAGVIVGSWPAQKLGPSGIFDHIELDTFAMVSMLDWKMDALVQLAGYSGEMFGKWLSAMREVALAVVFHGGEVISEGYDPLTAIVVTEEPGKRRILGETQKEACNGVMSVGVVGIADVMPLISHKEGGSRLRPFLSSELLVLGAQRDVEMLEAFFSALRSAFESHFLDDLASLVSADVRREVFGDLEWGSAKKPGIPIIRKEEDFTGKIPVKKRTVDEREFEKLAVRSMVRRRIPAGLQGLIMPKAKLAAGAGN